MRTISPARIPALLTLPLLLGSSLPSSSGMLEPPRFADEDDLVAALDEYLFEKAELDEFSGTVVLARGDQTLYAEAFGLASRRYGVPNDLDTKFNLGSMNKMFTGVAICQLVERGLLRFDTKVGEILPDWPQEQVREQVTVHQLLTHTSGLGSYWTQEFRERFASLRSVDDFTSLFDDQVPAFPPGERFAYSNCGPVLLGALLERITGQSYDDSVREHVTGPCEMTGTDCYELDDPVPNLAMGYTHRKEDGTRSDTWRSNLFVHSVKGGPAGGGYSTAPDLVRFARAVMEHRLLSAEMTERMLEGKVEMGPGMRYAYLFGDHREKGVRYCGHNGGAPGINAELSFFPESGHVLAVLANQDDAASTVAEYARGLLIDLLRE